MERVETNASVWGPLNLPAGNPYLPHWPLRRDSCQNARVHFVQVRRRNHNERKVIGRDGSCCRTHSLLLQFDLADFGLADAWR